MEPLRLFRRRRGPALRRDRAGRLSQPSRLGAGLLWGLAAALLLGGCAETRLAVHTAKAIASDEPKRAASGATYKVGNPYQINGVWYYPREQPDYDETGIASWYGDPFHGRQTANGETYDMNALTAAHPTLPLPTNVRVTNLENGRSIIVRVNDRGPFVNGRLIDMSRRGAQLLGFHEKGTAKVRVSALEAATVNGVSVLPKPETTAEERTALPAAPPGEVAAARLAPPPGGRAAPPREVQRQPAPQPVQIAAPPPPQPSEHIVVVPVRPSSIFVQAGAFTRYDNANRLSAQLSPYGPSRVSRVLVDGVEFFRVRVGPLDSVERADQTLQQLIASGRTDARIVVD